LVECHTERRSIRERTDAKVVERVRLPLGADPQVLKILGNPNRYEIFSRLGERPWSAVELEAEVGIPYEQVREHLRILVDEGLAECVGHEASPLGGRRTLYIAERFYFTAEEWAALPEDIRKNGSLTYVELFAKDALDAIKSDTMDSREDRVLIRRPLWTDDRGAKEVEEIMVRADQEIAGVEQRSLERRNRSGELPVRLITAFLAFPAAKRGGENSP
jgi:DNA-binding transcriptional ArsR family regulator